MPKYLSCPEIARRMGYSRMQVARWAKNNMIPGSRIITQGYHYRYELTPTLAAWIRIRRRKGRERHMGLVGAVGIDEQGNRVVPCEIICEEINELISEIVRRIGDISPPNPTPHQEGCSCLHPPQQPPRTRKGMVLLSSLITMPNWVGVRKPSELGLHT